MRYDDENEVNNIDEVNWSADERAALDRLPRDRQPSAELERATVSVLTRSGMLREPRSRSMRAVLAAAAALILFGAGVAAGYVTGVRHGRSLAPTRTMTEAQVVWY